MLSHRHDDMYVSSRGHELLMRELKSEYDAWRALENIAVNGNVSLVDAALESNYARQYGAALPTNYKRRRTARRGHDHKTTLVPSRATQHTDGAR